MENVSFYNDESVVLWQINPFPDYPFFALNQSVSNTNTSGQLTIWNDLSREHWLFSLLYAGCWSRNNCQRIGYYRQSI